jgi:hypothetical protein
MGKKEATRRQDEEQRNLLKTATLGLQEGSEEQILLRKSATRGAETM